MATYNTFKDLASYLGVDPNNPTPESQKIVYDWMRQNPEYEAGPVTNQYMEGYEPPQDIVPQEQPAPVSTPTNTIADIERAKGEAHANGNLYYQPEQFKPATQPTEPTERKTPDFSKFKDTEAFDRGMLAWSPLAPSIIKGGDMSGEAAGYRAGATIQDKAAADNAKIMQWNKQRAMDNTLADKVAAAQASGQWRQNANALGAEGGASVVASQNEAVTPDIMAQKQYQSQQMNTATQNLAEVNARKVAAQNNRTKADMTDYNTQYNESKDAYATNLATAKNAQDKSTEEKKETPKTEGTTSEATEKPNGKVDDTDTQNNEPQAAAETNQQSQATETATQEVSEQRELQDLADEINGIHNAVESMKHNSQTNSESLRKQKARYDEIKPRYDELAAKSKNPPPQASTPDFSMFDEKYSEVPESILSGVSQRF